MEDRFDRFLQPAGRDRLSDPVSDSRDAERSGTCAKRLGYLHRPHRGREPGPRRHPIPDPIQIALQIDLELIQALAIHSRRASILLHLQVGLPDLSLPDLKRLALRLQLAHSVPPGRSG